MCVCVCVWPSSLTDASTPCVHFFLCEGYSVVISSSSSIYSRVTSEDYIFSNERQIIYEAYMIRLGNNSYILCLILLYQWVLNTSFNEFSFYIYIYIYIYIYNLGKFWYKLQISYLIPLILNICWRSGFYHTRNHYNFSDVAWQIKSLLDFPGEKSQIYAMEWMAMWSCLVTGVEVDLSITGRLIYIYN